MSGIDITWLGHATVLIEMDGVRVLTDPALTGRIGPLKRYAPPVEADHATRIDAVVISHLHRDHFHLPSLRRMDARTQIGVPRGAGGLLSREGYVNVVEVTAGESFQCGAVKFQAVPAAHGSYRPPFGPNTAAVGYLISGSSRVYFPGDTGPFDGMSDICPGDLDLALMPVGGWWVTMRSSRHLSPRTAAEALTLLRPRKAVPIHWGTLWPFGMRRAWRSRFEQAGELFASYAAGIAPDVDVRVLRPGASLAITCGGGE
jgi:L-ascorbate metabolism protein UlaG (beta-lactamase superfamily)